MTGRAGWSAAGVRSGSRSAWSWLAKAGNLDDAFGQLDAAIACREPALVHLAVAPQSDPMRADEPRAIMG